VLISGSINSTVMRTDVFLAPATDRSEAYDIFRQTVLEGVPRDVYGDFTESDYGERARIWGLSEFFESTLTGIESGDWVLFYTGSNRYSFAARVREMEKNPKLGEIIRSEFLSNSSDDRDWNILLFLDESVSISISGQEVADLFGYSNYYPSRFIRVPKNRLESLKNEYGNIDEFVHSIEK